MRITAPEAPTPQQFLRIAVGVLQNDRGEVLICQRPSNKLYPGEWEFPGGKVERGETAEEALRRELSEELGVSVRACRPLIRVRHVYPELAVQLETWLVSSFEGTILSTEHPSLAWVQPDALPSWQLLAADRPIVAALRLPAYYVFTPPKATLADLLHQIGKLPHNALLRLRLPDVPDSDYEKAAAGLLPACKERKLRLILDRDPEMVSRIGAAGWHASAERLREMSKRPVAAEAWFGASVHCEEELFKAREIAADFAVLGPVQTTASHPGAAAIGWRGFTALARHANLPVYAIGGLRPDDLEAARATGAQGIAGITGFWRAPFTDAT